MIPLKEFKAENEEIVNLCNVLTKLVADYEMCNNPIVCELTERFLKRVKSHLSHEDKSIYSDLLAKHTADAKKVAEQFVGNTQQLKRVLKEHEKGWCCSEISERAHQKYASESQELFRLVCDRIDYEDKKIFPLFAD